MQGTTSDVGSFSFHGVRAWLLSVVVHVALGMTFLLILSRPKDLRLEFEVIDIREPQTVPRRARRSAISAPGKVAPRPEKQDPDPSTLASESEEGGPPSPTEEYLVSEMPVPQAEVRISYPEEAKNKGIEGPVVLDLLIDPEGRVRESVIVSGPGHGLNEAAQEALLKFRFKPAMMAGRSVAVRIRYVYRFVLER